MENLNGNNMKVKILKENQTIIEKAEVEKIRIAEEYITNRYHIEAANLTNLEVQKTPLRSEIINFILKQFSTETFYLEIGVRHRLENFDL